MADHWSVRGLHAGAQGPGLAEQPHLLDELAVQKRYLGGGSLNGMSRNALSPCSGELKRSGRPAINIDGPTSWSATKILHCAFERRLGLYPALAVVVAENLEMLPRANAEKR